MQTQLGPPLKGESHPSEWWAGFNTQRPRCTNPYSIETEQGHQWLLGWEARYFQEDP